MTLSIQKFARVPFFVDAVQVTEENMEEVAEWCGGQIMDFDETARVKTKRFIKIKVHNPQNPRQTQAFEGDYVLFASKGFKTYNKPAFDRTFEPVFQKRTEEIPSGSILPGPRPDAPPRESRIPLPGPRKQKSEPIPDEQVKKFQESLHVISEEEIMPGIVATRVEELQVVDPSAEKQRPQLGDDELSARGLPTSIQEGYEPIYTDQVDVEPAKDEIDLTPSDDGKISEDQAAALGLIPQRGDSFSYDSNMTAEEAQAAAQKLAKDIASEKASENSGVVAISDDDLCPLDGIRRADHNDQDHPFAEQPTS